MTTLAMSGLYALVSSGWTRINTVRTDSGVVRFVSQANGSPILEVPTAYMTSGHMTRIVADSGKRTSMAVIAPTIIADVEHAWKTTKTLDEMAGHRTNGLSEKDLQALKVTLTFVAEQFPVAA